MFDEKFTDQLRLLLMCLPSVASEELFALKGGTAINLFFMDLPRLSVDIDLTYLPIEKREATINGINMGLRNIIKKVEELFPKFVTRPIYDKSKTIVLKYMIFDRTTSIKIEPNFVLRGHLYPIQKYSLCKSVIKKFDVKLDNVPILDKDEVFAGKLCAALSRQHPRDLFDMMLLLNNGGITERIRKAFVVYLASSSKPMHEILNPTLHDIKIAFNEFKRMTDVEVRIDELLDVRTDLIKSVKKSLDNNEREFLLSMKAANPNFDLMPFDNLAELPGIKWKLLNIKKMDKSKAEEQLSKLKLALDA